MILGFALLVVFLALRNPRGLMYAAMLTWHCLILGCIAIVAAFLLVGLARAEAPLKGVQIKLTGAPPPKQTHLVCEVDDVHFMVPRRIVESGDEFILVWRVTKRIDDNWKSWTVRLGLPYLRHLCREF